MGVPDSQLGVTEPHAAEPAAPAAPEDSGLQEHSEDNCLYCSGLAVLGLKSHNSRPGETEEVERVYSEYKYSNIVYIVYIVF